MADLLASRNDCPDCWHLLTELDSQSCEAFYGTVVLKQSILSGDTFNTLQTNNTTNHVPWFHTS